LNKSIDYDSLSFFRFDLGNGFSHFLFSFIPAFYGDYPIIKSSSY